MKTTLTGALAMLLFFASVAIAEDTSAEDTSAEDTSAEDTSAEDTSEEQAIKQTLVAMWDAIENGDVDRYASYIHPEFTAFGENDVYIAKGKEREVAGYADYLKRASDVHTEMHQPEVRVKGDVAWITYYWTDHGMSGGERFTSRGKSTRIFVKEDGKWLCIHGHYTAVP